MKVLFLAAELAPYAKVGGLADVAAELPASLVRQGVDIRVCLPLHASVDRTQLNLSPLAQVQVTRAGAPIEAVVWHSKASGVDVYWIDGEPIRSMDGIYSHAAQEAEKYVFWALAALESLPALGWTPDLIHANDWQAAAAVLRLHRQRTEGGARRPKRSLFTLHNLPFMGAGSETALAAYGLSPSQDLRLPDWARNQPLPMAVSEADWLSTVSPTYAQEIQDGGAGHGLEGILTARRDRLAGILNGIDLERWNPAADADLAVPFDSGSVARRLENRSALLAELGWPTDSGGPLLGMVGRLDRQKGVDLVFEALDQLGQLPWQFVLLGSGDPVLEAVARRYAEDHPDRVMAVLRFDGRLARRIYAGVDMILVPSRYEPCGLAQLIGMRYGAVPVVRDVGGLHDSVEAFDGEAGGTGFRFDTLAPEALAGTLRDAIAVWHDKPAWAGLQSRAMLADHSWPGQAEVYKSLYESILKEPPA